MKFGENVKTATMRALKHHGGPLRDNLSDLLERKALRRAYVENHSWGLETKLPQ